MKKFLEILFYVSFGAGISLGTSSFTMISGLFEVSNSFWVLVALCLAGLFCILISTSVAELASMYPSSPGIRTYMKRAYGNRTSLVLVYLYLIFMVAVAGVESNMFALVVKTIFPQASTALVIAGLLAFTMTINLLGLELPRGLQILTTVFLILSVVAVGMWGILQVPPEIMRARFLESQDVVGNLKVLPALTVMAIFLFTGFEWVTLVGLNPAAYKRRIPLAMPAAIVINIVAYFIFTAGLMLRTTREDIVATTAPQIPYLNGLSGVYGLAFAFGISILAIFSTFNSGIMGGSRLIHIMTREGNLPAWCAKMSLRTGAPVGGIVVLGCLVTFSSLLIVRYDLALLAAVVGAAIASFIYAAFVLAAIRLRTKQPDAKRSYRSPLARWLQWSIILFLPLMGIQSLFSVSHMHYRPGLTLVVIIIISLLMARWSLLRTSNGRSKAF